MLHYNFDENVRMMKKIVLSIVFSFAGLNAQFVSSQVEAQKHELIEHSNVSELTEIMKLPLRMVTEPAHNLNTAIASFLSIGDRVLQALNDSTFIEKLSQESPAVRQAFSNGEKLGWLTLAFLQMFPFSHRLLSDSPKKGYNEVRLALSSMSLLIFAGMTMAVLYAVVFKTPQEQEAAKEELKHHTALTLKGIQHGLVYPFQTVASSLISVSDSIGSIVNAFGEYSKSPLGIRLAFSAGYLATQFFIFRYLTYLHSFYFPGTAANPVVLNPYHRFAHYAKAFPVLASALHISQELAGFLGS